MVRSPISIQLLTFSSTTNQLIPLPNECCDLFLGGFSPNRQGEGPKISYSIAISKKTKYNV